MTLSSEGGTIVAPATAAEPAAGQAQPVAPAASAPPSDPAPPPSTEEVADWRKQFAGDDADGLKLLERFSDPQALFESYKHAQKTISSGKRIDAPQADWGEEQWAAFYDKLGRPKDANGYKVELKLPEGVELPDETKAVLGNVTQAGHKLGLTPQQMQGVHEFVANLAVEQLQQSEKAIAEMRVANERALKDLWGPEYDRNVRYAQAAANQLHRETGVDWRGLAEMVMQDGAKLGDRVEFVRLMAAAGRALDVDPLLDVRAEGVAKSVEDRKKELMDLRITDPRRYQSAEVQQELNALNSALERRQELAR